MRIAPLSSAISTAGPRGVLIRSYRNWPHSLMGTPLIEFSAPPQNAGLRLRRDGRRSTQGASKGRRGSGAKGKRHTNRVDFPPPVVWPFSDMIATRTSGQGQRPRAQPGASRARPPRSPGLLTRSSTPAWREGAGPARQPSEAGERHPPRRVEPHTLSGEQLALERLEGRLGAGTDSALVVHHPVPGNPRVAQRRERIAHLTGAPRNPRDRSDLTVGGDPPARDAGHHPVDSFVRSQARGHRQRLTPDRRGSLPSPLSRTITSVSKIADRNLHDKKLSHGPSLRFRGWIARRLRARTHTSGGTGGTPGRILLCRAATFRYPHRPPTSAGRRRRAHAGRTRVLTGRRTRAHL